jgi:2-deoxy-D-gluconate 3-dehydrogenase
VVEVEVTRCGRKFYPYQADLSNRASLYSFIQSVKKDFQHLDILVNNAGSIRRAPTAEHSDEDWDAIIDLNLDAPFILAREFGRDMIARGQGKIIFTASLLTFQGGVFVPGYAASKGAIGSLVKALSNEWAVKGVQVNAIAPGYIATDNTEALRNDPVRSKSILDRIPAGRWGEPDDFKGPIVFLASNASNYMTGTILTVDGGWMGR